MIKLEARGLNYSYFTGQPVLKNINLTVNDGTVTVLLGLNGSGKTTLIKLMSGILKSPKEVTFINGKDVSTLSSVELSKMVSYVPQNISDDSDFEVLDYLTFGRLNTIKFYASPRKEDYNKSEQIAAELGIVELLNKKMNELSGGQRQLVTIARAVVQDAKIIIMDEPTSSIDYKFLDIIIQYTKKLSERGKTLILSCHNPSIPLLLNADVVVLEKGEIKTIGNARKVLTIQALRNIYGCEFVSSDKLPYEEASLLPLL